jgi:tetratricopeptide (TPR) repeat protein
LQNYQDEIKLAVDSTTAGLEGSQDNVRNLGLIMTAGLLGHVEQLSTLDQTDYQADQARLEKLASYQQGWEQVGRELEDILVPLKRADAAARGAIQTDQRLKIEGDARSGIALNQQAIIAYHRGFRLMALAYLEQAARFAPGDIQIGLNLALISLEMNRVDQAEQAWRKATQLSPDSLEVRYVEGMIALQRADTQRAIDVFEACIIAVSNPSDEVAYRSGLAQAYYRHGLARQAILQWEKVLEMEPMHPAAKSWLWAVR